MIRSRYAVPTIAAALSATCAVVVASNERISIVSFGRTLAEPGAVQEGAAAALGRPLLAGAEVVDVAEDDVAHRGAVGDGEREGEEGDVALGVQRAVDRVADDAPRLPAPEDALAELLRDEREALVERLEPVHDGGLGGRVDRGRVVAALAGLQHGLALDARRQLGEHRLDVAHRVAADVEPRLHRGWKSRPEISFGKKYVVFCGNTSPRRA